MMRQPHLALVALALFWQAAHAASAQPPHVPPQFQAFLSEYCIDCHQGPEAEANLDLSKLNTALADQETLRRWARVHDRIAAGEMPPAEMPQPRQDETAAALGGLAAALTAA